MCAGGEYHALATPVRVYSSDNPGINEASPARKTLGTVFDVDVLGSADPGTFENDWLPVGVEPSEILAVALVLSADAPTGNGDFRVYPSGGAAASPSAVNFNAGVSVSNMAIVRPNPANGKITVQMAGTGTTGVKVDVVGWFSTSGYIAESGLEADARGARLLGMPAPVRILDTRQGAAADTPVAAGATIELDIRNATVFGTGAAVTQLADANVSSVVVNVTSVFPAENTTITLLPEAGAPTTTSLLAMKNDIRAGMAIVKVGSDGKIRLTNASAGASNVLVDVMGYFKDGELETTRTGRVVPLSQPFRVLRTDQAAFGGVPLGPGQAEDWSFAAFSNSVNIGGVSVGSQSALLGNLTNNRLTRLYATTPVRAHMTVYPPSASLPGVSNLNTLDGRLTGNMVMATYGANQTVRVLNAAGYSQYILDVYAVVLS
ncbi:MAG: hypothetical protein RL238_1491 [Actinomycetota bacterium]